MRRCVVCSGQWRLSEQSVRCSCVFANEVHQRRHHGQCKNSRDVYLLRLKGAARSNKKLSKYWDSATCKRLDAILAAKLDTFRTRFRAYPVAVGACRWYHSICRMQFPISVLFFYLTHSLHRFRHYCQRSVFLHVFVSNTGSQDTTIRVGIGMQVAKTPTYPVKCRFPLFIALCDHNPPTLQTDGQTDGRHARSISSTCQARMPRSRLRCWAVWSFPHWWNIGREIVSIVAN